MDLDGIGAIGSGRSISRRDALRKAALGGALVSLPLLAAACDSGNDSNSSDGNGSASAGNFPKTPPYKFVFINHVTTNPFFVPTIYGLEDASAVLDIPKPQWTGSETADVTEMVNAMNTAISGGADGIAVAVVDVDAFKGPIQDALDAGIPVVSYNADGTGLGSTPRLSYIGQDLFGSGVEMGKRIVDLVGSGPVALFIATPGQLNIQPRIDGAIQAIKDSGASIDFEQIKTGAELPDELDAIDAYYNGHKDLKGMFAVDAGSTQGTAQIMEKYGLAAKGVHAGGYDLLPETLKLIDEGHLDFTIDQQPYLQGFYPVFQLFVYKISGGISGPAETNTGLLFVTKDNVGGYLNTSSRFEGDDQAQKIVQPAS